ncbi:MULTISPECIES: PH domain-containing protein [Auritidibacter]|uniref:PH domain-containing protein n=1 Tax=Auritidibacter ignavus TaxID=678932 RepID=A0AAJ6ANX4_9MICC|nr:MULTISPECIES: PH domain-containing protein [Auritidibacter]NIH72771.1 hypothetical protein [Auritidibacter ignavus]PXA77252.1 hypothetical protein DCC24_04815 [Auritidibacter sp. NML100628]PXA80101.1 hypothetical protein DCC25_06690 [Auritidibacter sp. NML120636]RMX23840.1 PH domain-containing protein [Auritidibacter ignavus]WGH84818.1 PH domain-containing protein [Auritidibacter ignavus]
MAKLVTGEQMRIRTRADASILIGPAIWLVLLGGLQGAWQGFLTRPDLPWALSTYDRVWSIAGTVVVVLLLAVLVVRPVWQWLTEVYEITTHRVAQRYGTLSVRRRWMALSSIVHIRIRQSRRQTRRGVGDLQLFTAQGQSWTLTNVPHVDDFTHFVENERLAYARKFGTLSATYRPDYRHDGMSTQTPGNSQPHPMGGY